MFWVTVILILQTTLSLLLIFLRTHSFRRTLSKPKDNYPTVLLNWLKHNNNNNNKTTVKSPFGIRTGAVRSRLISQWATDLTLYTNFNGFHTLLNDSTEVKSLIHKLNQYEITTLRSNDPSHSTDSTHSQGKTLYGFFHPYCNAFGGGEKVLWKAVQTTLDHDLNNVALIYTGDIDASPQQILDAVRLKFDYRLDTTRIVFIYLKKRYLVDPGTWPRFTLLGQALGSVLLTLEAILKCPPDVWCDTMGYPFGYPWVFHLIRVPIVTYTHFPVMSTDMLDKLQKNNNNSWNWKTFCKYLYWKSFMIYYSHMGSFVTIATTNSTWTNNHIKRIWKQTLPSIIYPPCSTEKFTTNIHSNSNTSRSNVGVVLAQFRPEKRHDLIIESYSKYLINRKNHPQSNNNNLLTLKFIGSTRSQADKDRVLELQNYCKTLHIPDTCIEFLTDIPYNDVRSHLLSATYGINAMWNEHFGIAVVEYLASGLIALVHASAGPYLDIVDDDIGYFFVDPSDPDYSRERGDKFPRLHDLFLLTDTLDDGSKRSMSKRGERKALEKFSDEIFEVQWTNIVLHKLEERGSLTREVGRPEFK